MNKKLFKLAVLGAFASTASVGIANAAGLGDLMPNAKPGECFARAVVPAKYRTETSTIVIKEASEQLKIIPAKYETVEERVLVSEAGSELRVVPATFGTESSTYEVSPSSSRWVMGTVGSSVGADSALVAMARASGAAVDSARAGSCFAEHFEAPTYKSVTERVLVSEASEKINLVPAKYEWVEQRVMVSPAARKLVEVPAQYEQQSQRVMVEEAKTVWKEGRGAIEKIDNGTGNVMCLVEIPAVFKTISKRVVKTPATTRVVEEPARYETIRVRKLVADATETRVAVPAKYDTVTKRIMESGGAHNWQAKGARGNFGKPTGNVICLQETPAKMASVSRQVVKTPASVRRVEIPAKYETKRVRRLVEDAKELRTAIPAVTDTVTKRIKVSDERMEWQSVICEVETPASSRSSSSSSSYGTVGSSASMMKDVQRALRSAGFNPGPIDGIYGRQTMSALKSFQSSRGLSTNGLTTESLKRLGVQR